MVGIDLFPLWFSVREGRGSGEARWGEVTIVVQ